MAFDPRGTNYAAMLSQRAQADRGLTEAKRRRGERDRQARIKKSGERSGLQKLVSAGVRGAAAYYTGGMSEQMGMGGAIDSAMLGTDSEGGAVRNEYGDLVGTGAAVYQAGKSMKDAKLAKQDAKFDKLRDRRMQNVQMLFDAGLDDKAMMAQKEIENMETGYMSKRKGMEGGWNPFAHSDEDYSSLQPSGMNKAQREAKEAQLNQAAKGQTDQGQNVVGPPSVLNPASTQPQQTQPQSQPQPHSPHSSGASMPPPASSVKGPNIADMVDRQAKSRKKRDEEIKAMPGSKPIDFSDALLSHDERKNVVDQGHYVGPKASYR